jgi:uncharacterized membrane protein YdbT with pleckstrin-like domain
MANNDSENKESQGQQTRDDDIVSLQFKRKDLRKMYRKIRMSLVVLITKILLVQLIFLAIGLLSSYILLSLDPPDPPAFTTETVVEDSDNDLLFLILVGLRIINFMIVFYLLLRWYYEYYIITPIDIVVHRGPIIRRRSVYQIPAIQAVRVYQSVFGRLFRFGTIKLESPLLDYDVYLRHIPKPERTANIIEEERLKHGTDIKTSNIIPTA